MRPLQCFVAACVISSAAATWPGSLEEIGIVKDVQNFFKRQDSGSTGTNGRTLAGTAPQSLPTSARPPASSSGDASQTGDASNTASGSGTARVTGSGSGTRATGTLKPTSNATSTDFDPRLPAGGIQMVTPAPISGSQYYKVGDFVTFAWNYTSLEVTPTAIDILASCKANQATYTLAVNQTVEPTGQVIWDTGEYQKTATIPLLTETYTLVIYDADSSISAVAKAGYLAPYKQYQFGMYLPQPYTPFSDFKCPTCLGSGALSEHERQTISVMLGVTALTVLSFTWFAGGRFGLF